MQRKDFHWGGVVALAVLGLCIVAEPAQAGLDISEGHWRLELRGGTGIHQGSRDRTGDTFVLGGIEYEVPASRHGTLGLRLLPLMVYEQEDSSDQVLGAGLGLTGRIYQRGEIYEGLFVEIEANVLLQEDVLEGNSAHVNFLTGAGLGYQFGAHFSAALKYQHISNAGLSEHNAGANSVAVSLGFRF